MLEESLLSLSCESEDNHVVDLAKRCRILEMSGKMNGRIIERASQDVVGHGVRSTEEREEAEKGTPNARSYQ